MLNWCTQTILSGGYCFVCKVIILSRQPPYTYLHKHILVTLYDLPRVVDKGHDIDIVVVAESVKDGVDQVSSNLLTLSHHRARVVNKNQHILGTGGSLNVP